MGLTYGFYNSVDHDRQYTATQMSQMFDGLVSDGIFENLGTALAVTPGTGLEVFVGIGRAWFNNTWSYNDTILPLSIDEPDLLLNRIDSVILEINNDEAVRANSIKILKGTPASSPVAPELTNTSFIHQYKLADILVKVGAVAFVSGDITSFIGTENTPYISLPNVATGADIDAGTSTSKVITPKSIGDATKLAYIEPGDAGNLLSSDGDAWISAVPSGWVNDLNTWTNTTAPLSRAYTNDPAAGSNVALNMADTSGFSKGDVVLVSSDAGVELTVLTAISTNVSITALYLALNHTTVNRLVRLIKPNAVVSVNADMTGKISVGTRIKLTQDGITKYFLVHAVGNYSGGNTLITLYTGPNIDNNYNNYLSSNPITNVYYSQRKAPTDFPLESKRWRYEIYLKGTTLSQASPTLGTWYNIGNVCLLLPIGDFKLAYKSNTGLCYGGTAGSITWASMSTNASAETNPEFTWEMAHPGTTLRFNALMFGSNLIKTISDTLYYFIMRVTLYNTVNLNMNNDTTFLSMFTFESAYL